MVYMVSVRCVGNDIFGWKYRPFTQAPITRTKTRTIKMHGIDWLNSPRRIRPRLFNQSRACICIALVFVLIWVFPRNQKELIEHADIVALYTIYVLIISSMFFQLGVHADGTPVQLQSTIRHRKKKYQKHTNTRSIP